jgi:hypothetical protein
VTAAVVAYLPVSQDQDVADFVFEQLVIGKSSIPGNGRIFTSIAVYREG